MFESKKKAHCSRWRLVLATILLAGCHTDPTIDASVADTTPCHLTIVGDLRVRNNSERIYVDARINDKSALLQFDTGADTTVLTPEAAKRLGLYLVDRNAENLSGIGGARNADRYGDADFQLGSLVGIHWNFLVADTNISHDSPLPDGLLSSDFLTRYDLDIDLVAGRIILYYPEHDCSHPSAFLKDPLYRAPLLLFEDHGRDKSLPGYGRAAPYRRAAPTINIEVGVGGKTLVAELDTGAPKSVFFLNGAAKLGMKPTDFSGDARVAIRGIGPNTVPGVRHILPSVDLGDLTILNLPVTLVDEVAADGTDMLLGLDVFERIHMWVSHSSGTLIMQFPPSASGHL